MTQNTKQFEKSVLVLGGTGFIGYHAVLEFLKKGYAITILSLPPLPKKGLFPPEVSIRLADLNTLSDEAVVELMQGHSAALFAAGADDRITPKKPAYDFFYKANVESSVRFFKLAKKAGITRGVILSSYFLFFDRTWPELKLSAHHPYIRSRKEQAKEAIAFSKPELDLMILELPYIFGSMPGRKPLWCPLITYIQSFPVLLYPKGGTNMITVEHVAEAIVGAVEYGKGGEHYTIGDKNMSWKAFLKKLSRCLGKEKRVVSLPNFLVTIATVLLKLKHKLQGREGGLDPVAFTKVQTAQTFFDPDSSRSVLRYGSGGLDDAFKKTVEACVKKE
ncbi:NAD-dependent epimerase/dehydratase family protein [Patescibacteria group bacterium]|nr:NAD-dependent epimerase/dehydratase family protein [Patescibacteria group bacterium]